MDIETVLSPPDAHNQTLRSHVHPPDWVNPTPKGRYHLVVLGAGTAGLVTASAAAGLGAKVALVERDLMGGDCLNVGCVPSKGLIRAGRTAADVKQASAFGVHVESVHVDFPSVMQRMRQLRAQLSPHDSARRYQSLGVDVYLGAGHFVDADTVVVGAARLGFRQAVIATGARAADPGIPGLKEVGYRTNESIFSLTQLPHRLAVIGGGPIGAELAQTFARLGADVVLIETHDRILFRDDPEAARIVQASLQRDGVRFRLQATVMNAEPTPTGKRLQVSIAGQTELIEVDEILVAVGRAPNVEGLGLETVGVQHDAKTGVQVNDRLQTTNRRIWACGDVCSTQKFTHAADFQARLVIRNALFWGRGAAPSLVVPRCTYTAPELATVGLTGEQADRLGIKVDVLTQPLARNDRALLDGQAEGFVRAIVRRGTDQLVGAVIVADHAGEMIGLMSLMLTHRLGLAKLASTIFPYPTQAEAMRRLGDDYQRSRLTPTVKHWLQQWLKWTG